MTGVTYFRATRKSEADCGAAASHEREVIGFLYKNLLNREKTGALKTLSNPRASETTRPPAPPARSGRGLRPPARR